MPQKMANQMRKRKSVRMRPSSSFSLFILCVIILSLKLGHCPISCVAFLGAPGFGLHNLFPIDHRCPAITGGAGIARGRGGGAAKTVWPTPLAARSRNDEYSLFRDHMINAISLLSARVVLTSALKSGHQTNHQVG